jgi:hypothetical protein
MKLRMPYHLRAYICVHVLEKSAPILLVSRAGDGNWCFLCGEANHNDASTARVIGIGHVFERDPTLLEIEDLDADWDAEREAVGKAWIRTRSIPN